MLQANDTNQETNGIKDSSVQHFSYQFLAIAT